MQVALRRVKVAIGFPFLPLVDSPGGRIHQQKQHLRVFGVKPLQLDALSAPRSTQEEVLHFVSSNLKCIARFLAN